MLNHKNILFFFIFNLIRRFLLLLGLFFSNYIIFYLGNTVKLGVFPFTHIILLFYINLNINDFIILNIAKLPYLTLTNLKLHTVLTMLTILYVAYHIYKTNNMMVIITIYRVISTVIILNIKAKILNIYYSIRLLRIYLCLRCNFEVVRMYNLISLPLRLTFYVKIQFLLRLKFIMILIFLIRLTIISINIVKYITYTRAHINKSLLGLLFLNILLI